MNYKISIHSNPKRKIVYFVSVNFGSTVKIIGEICAMKNSVIFLISIIQNVDCTFGCL